MIVAITIIISFFGFTYRIVNDKIYITPLITTRSLMLIRSLIIPLFVYGIYKLFSTFSENLLTYYHKTSSIFSKINKQSYLIKILKFLERKKSEFKKIIFNFKRKGFHLKSLSVVIKVCLIFSVILIYLPLLWIKGSQQVIYNVIEMNSFKETGQCLETALEPEDLVLLPMDYIFYLNNPSLKEYGLNYDFIWEKSGVIFKADITTEELKIVRTILIDEIKNNPQIKYLVVDWMSNNKYIFNLNVTDDLYDLIYLTHEVKAKVKMWPPSILIYEVY